MQLPSTNSPELQLAPSPDSDYWDALDVRLDAAIIGAPKSGTNRVFRWLDQHPGVHVPNELNFFGRQQQLGPDYYREAFAPARPGQLHLDYSNTLMLDPQMPRILARWQPDIKLMFFCRNPVERAFSHYLMDITHGEIDPARTSFRAALQRPHAFSYFAHGLYAETLERFLEQVPRERIMVMLFDDLVGDPGAAYGRVLEFLDLEGAPEVDIEGAHKNSWEQHRVHASLPLRAARAVARPFLTPGSKAVLARIYWPAVDRLSKLSHTKKPRMDPADRRYLMDAYREDVERLGRLLDRDLGHWLSEG